MESFDFSQVISSSTTCGSSSVSGPHNPKLKTIKSFPRRRKVKSRNIHDHSTSDEGSLLDSSKSSLGHNNKTRISIKKGDFEDVAVVITRSKHMPTIKISIEFPEPVAKVCCGVHDTAARTKRRRRLLRWKRSSVPKTEPENLRKSEMVSIEERVKGRHCPSCSCSKNNDNHIPLCGLADVGTRPREERVVDYIEDITNRKDCPKTDESTKTNNTKSLSSSNSRTPSDIDSEGEVDCTTESEPSNSTLKLNEVQEVGHHHLSETNHMISTWNLIHQRMTKYNSESTNSESKTGNDSESEESEKHKTLATKIVKEAIEKILLPEVQDQTSDDQSSVSSESITPRAEENRAESNASGSTKAPKHWSHLKKWVLLQRFIGELEKVKELEQEKAQFLQLPEKVNLRPLPTEGRKKSEEWMLDYALRRAVGQLGPTQKRKVALLVRAFETVAPTKVDKPVFVENQESEGENRIKMWHMVYRHVVSGIAKKVGSRLLDGAEEDEEEVENDHALKLVKEAVCEIVERPEEPEAKKRWSKVKDVVLLKRSIRELEKGREVVEARAGDGVRVELRGRMLDEKIKAEQWMLDYAVQHIVMKLTPARKRRVCMLVEAFDAVVPLPEM